MFLNYDLSYRAREENLAVIFTKTEVQQQSSPGSIYTVPKPNKDGFPQIDEVYRTGKLPPLITIAEHNALTSSSLVLGAIVVLVVEIADYVCNIYLQYPPNFLYAAAAVTDIFVMLKLIKLSSSTFYS